MLISAQQAARLSGTQVLQSFDDVIGRAVGESKVLDQEIESLTARLVNLREQQTEAYGRLARLRLKDLSDNSIVADLRAAEEQARTLLSQRSAAVKSVDERIADVDRELARLGEKRAPLAAEVERLSNALTETEEAVLKRLAETEAYKAQLAAAEEAEMVARHAEHKTAFSEQDRSEKGKPYEDDPLFMYLWNRGYGTSAYDAGFIARYFDGRVARLIGYDKARANYTMLQDIPKRLAEHAERQRARASEQASRLDETEREALEASEAVERRKALSDAEKRLDDFDQQIEAAERRQAEIVEERTALTGGDDEVTRNALGLIVASLKRQDLQVLRSQALRTPLPEDDVLVARIEDLDAGIKETEKSLGLRKATQLEQRTRLAELEKTRREHRGRDRRKDAWDFSDGAMLGMVLSQVLNGGLSGGGLRHEMDRHRVPRRRGGFGGGGFSLSGGGFRTGGSIGGGGGFRTGGGF